LSAPEAPARAGEEPVFRAPWEAQAFAMVVALRDRGLITWTEWAEALGREVATQDADPDGYYGRWLAAAERLVAEKGLASAAALAERRDAFDRAARATPHGAPIRLENDPARDGPPPGA
jgi:nitrile hydratase accessory protein